MRLLTLFGLLLPIVNAQSELQSTFSGPSFFDNFDFYTSWDPTYGYVHYVDRATAEQHNMIKVTPSTVSWGVDTTQTLNPSANLGRLSIRLTSKQSWTHGLFIIDLAHMPANTCGVWPAVWTLGSGLWPVAGEIDIIEFVNNGVNNLMALHTSPGCTVAGADETGTLVSSDCGASGGITGCTVSATEPNTSGTAFNANGGGVYAMEWTSTAIRVWFFPRNDIPQSITMGAPDANTFGVPDANFQGSCDIDAHFYNHSLVFNIDFCGQYAGNVWGANGCPMLEASNSWQSCNDFVALNPTAFQETYWELNYVKVYQVASGVASSSTSSLSSATPAISSSAMSTALSGAQGRSSTPTQSLAGTVPGVTAGSYTDTSSILSALSSLSTKSEASASSASVSLVGRATSASSFSLSSSSISTPFATSSMSTSGLLTSKSTFVVSTSNPSTSGAFTVETSMPSSSSTTICLGDTCPSYTYVTVVQTVTVNAITAREMTLTARAEPSPSTMASPETVLLSDVFLRYAFCNFSIQAVVAHPFTNFACTQTILRPSNGTVVTESTTTTTLLVEARSVEFDSLLMIDKIEMTTIGAATTGTDVNAYTGSFNPTWTSTASTKLTVFRESSTPTSIAAVTPSPPQIVARSDEYAHCNFSIPGVHSGDRSTNYACTKTKFGIFNGTMYTETLTDSTLLLSGQALEFYSILTIDEIRMQTFGLGLFPTDLYEYTGNFTPSGTSTSLTILTATPNITIVSVGLTTSPLVAAAAAAAIITSLSPTETAAASDPRIPDAALAPRWHELTTTTTQYVTMSLTNVSLTTVYYTPEVSWTTHGADATYFCDNIRGPESKWTTSYDDAAWWILACEITPFPVSLAPWTKRHELTSPPAPVSVVTYTATSYTFEPTSTSTATLTKTVSTDSHDHPTSTSIATSIVHPTLTDTIALRPPSSSAPTQTNIAATFVVPVIFIIALVALGVALV